MSLAKVPTNYICMSCRMRNDHWIMKCPFLTQYHQKKRLFQTTLMNKQQLVNCFVGKYWKNMTLPFAPTDILKLIECWLNLSDSWNESEIDIDFSHYQTENVTKYHIAKKTTNNNKPSHIFGKIVIGKGQKQLWRFKILDCMNKPNFLIGIIDVDLISHIYLDSNEGGNDFADVGGYGLFTNDGNFHHRRISYNYPKSLIKPNVFTLYTEIIIELDLSINEDDDIYVGTLRYTIIDRGNEVFDKIVADSIDVDNKYKVVVAAYNEQDSIAIIQP
eukprot:166415_1